MLEIGDHQEPWEPKVFGLGFQTLCVAIVVTHTGAGGARFRRLGDIERKREEGGWATITMATE